MVGGVGRGIYVSTKALVAVSVLIGSLLSVASSWTLFASSQATADREPPLICVETELRDLALRKEWAARVRGQEGRLEAAIERLTEALEAAEGPRHGVERAPFEAPIVAEGCSAGFMTLPEGLPRPRGAPPTPAAMSVVGSPVDARGSAQVLVFVVDGASVRGASALNLPFEMECRGAVCREVSTALYISSAASDDEIGDALIDALGLGIPEPAPPGAGLEK
jgi:hypothetical protein